VYIPLLLYIFIYTPGLLNVSYSTSKLSDLHPFISFDVGRVVDPSPKCKQVLQTQSTYVRTCVCVREREIFSACDIVKSKQSKVYYLITC